MGDLVFLAIVVAFFGLAVLFVRGCEAILGPDETAAAPSTAAPRQPSGKAAA